MTEYVVHVDIPEQHFDVTVDPLGEPWTSVNAVDAVRSKVALGDLSHSIAVSEK